MEREDNGNPRLGVDDKRYLFFLLMSKVERLFYLNKFPVDQEDFALSLLEPGVEQAWRLLMDRKMLSTLSPSHTIRVPISTTMPTAPDDELIFMLSAYHGDEPKYFMNVSYRQMQIDNRFREQVWEWANRQVKLEAQMQRTIKVIKALVHSCNTVGQYARVSPELLSFLPSKYGDALKEYTKKSPYPAIDVEEKEIDTALSTLAYASLQPEHTDETRFTSRQRSYWNKPNYQLSEFPHTKSYTSLDVRQLRI